MRASAFALVEERGLVTVGGQKFSFLVTSKTVATRLSCVGLKTRWRCWETWLSSRRSRPYDLQSRRKSITGVVALTRCRTPQQRGSQRSSKQPCEKRDETADQS